MVSSAQRQLLPPETPSPRLKGKQPASWNFHLISFCLVLQKASPFLSIQHMSISFFLSLPKGESPGPLLKGLRSGMPEVSPGGALKDKEQTLSPFFHPSQQPPLVSYPWHLEFDFMPVLITLPAFNPIFSRSGFHGTETKCSACSADPL